SLGSYRSHGGYQALETALAIGGEKTLRLITDAGLTGRGGAAFPTGRKWQAVADQDHIHKYVVANADESEPGTFKDRMIIENDPFALIEAMTIAGVTTGCTKGWIYIRGEYVTATKRLQSAIKQAYENGFLGANALNGAFTFDIELRQGAGAYICGEETALFNSIEGFRGEPRSKPPFPTDQGLFGCPTIVNNPETLINVLEIVNYGVDSFRSVGTADSPGTKLFCLSGDVAQPGLYEAAFGLPLNELLNTAGVRVGDVQAVLLGGAAGSFLGPQALDLPLSFEDTAERGATLGSGAVTVFSRDVDLWPVLVRLAKFFRDESCGQCVPCRIGTTRQHEVLLQIQGTAPQESTRDLLSDLSLVMGDSSICGLGHTAASAVQSALALGLVGAET
ncbi:MAG: complex I 51 kDa subunit family protein, partial [Acidimicrobiales bacterium]